MKGKHSITVGNNILQYKFEICRNITIIKGDSATGKTTLVELIQEYYENGEQSGITLQCDKECVVLEGRQWKVLLQTIQDSIVFIDEGNSFVATDDFADAVKKATDFISKSLKFTTDLNLPNNYGVCFEEFLTELK